MPLTYAKLMSTRDRMSFGLLSLLDRTTGGVTLSLDFFYSWLASDYTPSFWRSNDGTGAGLATSLDYLQSHVKSN